MFRALLLKWENLTSTSCAIILPSIAHQVAKSDFIGMACLSMKSHSGVLNLVTQFMAKMQEDVKKEMADSLRVVKRFLAVLSEWTSIRNKRLLNFCVATVSSC